MGGEGGAGEGEGEGGLILADRDKCTLFYNGGHKGRGGGGGGRVVLCPGNLRLTQKREVIKTRPSLRCTRSLYPSFKLEVSLEAPTLCYP